MVVFLTRQSESDNALFSAQSFWIHSKSISSRSDQMVRSCGLTTYDVRCLEKIRHEGVLCQRELVRVSGICERTVRNCVKRLVRQGLIEEFFVADDLRLRSYRVSIERAAEHAAELMDYAGE